MSKICFTLLIGLPAAGKTTFASMLNQRLQIDKIIQCHTITYDDIIKDYKNRYKELRNGILITVEDIIKSILNEVTFNRHIILIDDNLYYKSMRYEYYKLARKYRTSFLEVFFDVQLEIALFRNKYRSQQCKVREEVLIEMASKFEKPEELWEHNITINSNIEFGEDIFVNVFQKLDKCFLEPIQNIFQEVSENLLIITNLQRVDLLLRKIVHEKIKQGKTVTKSHEYITRKKEIYHKIKNGDIILNENCDENGLYRDLEKLFELTQVLIL